MKKRIYKNISIVSISTLFLMLIFASTILYFSVLNTAKKEVKNFAESFYGNNSESSIIILNGLKYKNMNISVISLDGEVKYTNSDNSNLSDNIYFEIILEDNFILKISKNSNLIFYDFIKYFIFYILIFMFLLLYILIVSSKLSRRIVQPIKKIDLKKCLNDDLNSLKYEELYNFIKIIKKQNMIISRQKTDLKQNVNTVDSIMDNMTEGMIISKKNGIILSINKSASEIFDLSDNIIGKNILLLIRNIEFTDNVKKALGGQRCDMSFEKENKIFRVYFSPIDKVGIIILFLDITERFKAEKLRREFSSNVSHELKTPLTTILGNSELLLNNLVQENDKYNFYMKIKTEASRLIDLIEDIMMISKLDESTGIILPEDVDLLLVANEAIEALDQKAISKNIKVSCCGKNTVIKANKSQIFEVLYNLIDNSIKYNRVNGTIDIKIFKENSKSVITISDSGIGIPNDQTERVFERFYRVDKSRSKMTGGSGLGLAIVKHIIMEHNGEIFLESEEGIGTTVKIII